MAARLSVPPETDVLYALDRHGVEYLTVRPTRAVVVLGDGVLWVDALEGRLEAASTLELTPVETTAPDDAIVERFERLLDVDGR